MKEFFQKELEGRSLDILHFLNLDVKKNNMPISKQLEMVLKMYKYVVQNIKPINSFGFEQSDSSEQGSLDVDEKRKFAFEKLRQALYSNPGDSASNVILLNYLLFLKGFKSCIVLSESQNHRGEGHLSNLVEIGKDDWYFFDPTLERINFIEDQFGNPDEFSFDWAALGKSYYSNFYRPISVVSEIGASEKPISSYSVSDESLLRELVQSVGKSIPDLEYREKLQKVPEVDNHSLTKKERERDE